MGLIAVLALGAVVVLFLLVVRQRRQIARLAAQLSDATRTDPLTGLLNRRAFEALLDDELERARRTGRPLSVLIGDLDGLALVNAREGHRAGDAVLELVGRDLQKWKRRTDSAGRIGGEEFGLLLPETDEGGAYLVAERLRRAAHRTFGDHPSPVTISFGVAAFPEHADETDLLLSAAGRAMGAAKEMGRDRSVIYSAEVARLLAAASGSDGPALQLATVIGLAEALDIRDSGSTGHSHTVAHYCERMAVELGLDADQVERVRLAGLLHDVGKVGVSDQVLSKPGPLDAEEWQEMRTHPEIAARLLAHTDFEDLRAWILAHHERPDGRGYPAGLGAEKIPLEARILAVADAFEAMTADRVYRPALGLQAARAELQAGSGSQFDSDVVDALMGVLDAQTAASLSRAS